MDFDAATACYTVLLSRKATTQSTLQSISLCSRPAKYCSMVADKQSRACRLFPRPTPLVTYNHGMDNFETSTLYFKHNNGNKIIKICEYIKSLRLSTPDIFQNSNLSAFHTRDNFRTLLMLLFVFVVNVAKQTIGRFRVEFPHLTAI